MTREPCQIYLQFVARTLLSHGLCSLAFPQQPLPPRYHLFCSKVQDYSSLLMLVSGVPALGALENHIVTTEEMLYTRFCRG